MHDTYSIENFYSREKDMDLFVTMPNVIIEVVQDAYVTKKTIRQLDRLVEFQPVTSIVTAQTMDFINHHRFSRRFEKLLEYLDFRAKHSEKLQNQRDTQAHLDR